MEHVAPCQFGECCRHLPLPKCKPPAPFKPFRLCLHR